MNCDKCHHMAAIRAALKPCQVCEAGRMHHQVRFVGGASYCDQSCGLDGRVSEPTRVTHLAEADEDALRQSLCSLFSLRPIDLLLVGHLMRGRPMTAFVRSLGAVASDIKRLRSLGGGSGASKWAVAKRKRAILDAVPALADAINALIDDRRGRRTPL